MLNNITLGQYFPGTSFVHKLDPRTKLLATLLFIVAINKGISSNNDKKHNKVFLRIAGLSVPI